MIRISQHQGHPWPSDTHGHSDTPRHQPEPDQPVQDSLADLRQATQRWAQVATGEIPRDFGRESKGVDR